MANRSFSMNRDLQNSPLGLPSSILQQAQESRNQLLLSVETKKQIVHEVIDGRLPLIEAAAKFERICADIRVLHLNAESEYAETDAKPYSRTIAKVLPNDTDHESICRTVIGWVHLALSDRPERAEVVSDRLERELQAHLTRFGKIQLPPIK